MKRMLKRGPKLHGEGEFGNWLVKTLDRKQMHIIDLASELDVDPKVIRSITYRRKKPSRRTIIAICWALGELSMLEYVEEMVEIDWPDS